MNFFEAYETNPEREAKGNWFSKGFGGDCALLIARQDNAAYRQYIDEQLEQYRETLNDKSSPEARRKANAVSDKIMTEAAAQFLLLDWQGKVDGRDGNPMSYSVTNAKTLLELKDFRAAVEKRAGDFRNYLLTRKEEDLSFLDAMSLGS